MVNRYRAPFRLPRATGRAWNLKSLTSFRIPSSASTLKHLAATIVFVLFFLARSLLTAADDDPRPQAGSSATADEIRAVLDEQVAAWNRGDIEGFMNGYARSEKTAFVFGDTVTRGWGTVRDRYRKKYDSREKMGALTFSELEITQLSSDAAVVIGRWELKRANDHPHGHFTLILRRLSEGWRIVQDHTSTGEN